MLRLFPVVMPSVDLRAFADSVDRGKLNEIDSSRGQPTAKFAELVGHLLQDAEYAARHLHATFYFEMPHETAWELRTWKHSNQMRLTQADGVITRGFVSAAFDIWAEFLRWASRREASQFLRGYANLIHGYLRIYPYFSCLQVSNLRDNTYVLE